MTTGDQQVAMNNAAAAALAAKSDAAAAYDAWQALLPPIDAAKQALKNGIMASGYQEADPYAPRPGSLVDAVAAAQAAADAAEATYATSRAALETAKVTLLGAMSVAGVQRGSKDDPAPSLWTMGEDRPWLG